MWQQVRLDGPEALRVAAARWLPGVAVGSALLYLYLPVLQDLVAQWVSDPNYSHGFVIPLITAYLVWERREALQRSGDRGNAWGYVLLVASIALLMVGEAATFGYAARVSFLLALAGLIVFLRGADALRIVTFPLAYLLFMIPPPAVVMNAVAFPLQTMAAKLATNTLDVLGVPVFREGNVIALAAVRLEVTEACSGIRSLVALLALAVIFAYLTQRRWGPRVFLALSAVPIAIVTNAARITLTGVLVEIFGPGAGLGFYHEFSGLVIFVLAFLLLAAEGLVLSRLLLGWKERARA